MFIAMENKNNIAIKKCTFTSFIDIRIFYKGIQMSLKDKIHKLAPYCAVVESGSIQKGAKRIALSQPQVSKIIKELEDEIGLKLLNRSREGIKLTTEGRKLYEFASEILKGVDEIESLIRKKDRIISGNITIGTYDSIALYFFPDFLKFFNNANPDVYINLVTNRSSRLIKSVKAGSIDIGVVVGNSNYRGLNAEVIYEDFFSLYSSTNIRPEQEKTLIYFEGLEKDLTELKLSLNIKRTICCDNLETVKALTEKSQGIGLLPNKVARQGVLERSIAQLETATPKKQYLNQHQIHLVYPKAQDSINLLRNYFISEIRRYLKIWSKS
jgi:DNA-binding transcriptional LysR family regulator